MIGGALWGTGAWNVEDGSKLVFGIFLPPGIGSEPGGVVAGAGPEVQALQALHGLQQSSLLFHHWRNRPNSREPPPQPELQQLLLFWQQLLGAGQQVTGAGQHVTGAQQTGWQVG